MFRVDMVKNGLGQSVHGTLKLTVSQEWIDGMKAESYFSDFSVGMVRNGRAHLVHKILKFAASK